jgi:hypothetical protein
MNRKNTSDAGKEGGADPQPIQEQAREQTGQSKVRVHIDERGLNASYANGFRPTATPEEIILDFGLNIPMPPKAQKSEREIMFQAKERIIINYYTAKRLAVALGQIVGRYEREFGQLELNVAKRSRAGQGGK